MALPLNADERGLKTRSLRSSNPWSSVFIRGHEVFFGPRAHLQPIRRKPVFPLQDRRFGKRPGKPRGARGGRQRQEEIRRAARGDLDQRIEQTVSDGRRRDVEKVESVRDRSQ